MGPAKWYPAFFKEIDTTPGESGYPTRHDDRRQDPLLPRDRQSGQGSSNYNYELWSSDGTAGGHAHPVKDINPIGE